jgi:hypothetical protein
MPPALVGPLHLPAEPQQEALLHRRPRAPRPVVGQLQLQFQAPFLRAQTQVMIPVAPKAPMIRSPEWMTILIS